MSTTSSPSRRPFGKPAMSPPSTPIRVGLERRRDRRVQPQHFRRPHAGRLIQSGNARQEDRDQILARRRRRLDAEQRDSSLGTSGSSTKGSATASSAGSSELNMSFDAARNDHFVHQRLAEARDLDRIALALRVAVLAHCWSTAGWPWTRRRSPRVGSVTDAGVAPFAVSIAIGTSIAIVCTL